MVSVIMGVYNGASTVSEALNSILNQTYSNWELIVCDDCSVDNSAQIIQEYVRKDHRIKYIKNEKNVGLAASLNHCLKYVQGEYIARMDCDDLSAPKRFEVQVGYLQEHRDVDLVGSEMQEFDEHGYKNIVRNKEYPTKFDVPKGAPFCHATIMMRTSVMKALNGYIISNHTIRTEDVDLWYRFFAGGYKGVNIQETLYFVRMDEAAYKRRKIKYMLHASYIIWYGTDLLHLPVYYKVYCIKPIVSWLLPSNTKAKLRKYLIK